MLYSEVQIGQEVIIATERQRHNNGVATVEAKNDQLQLVKLSFDVKTKGIIGKGRKNWHRWLVAA